MLQVSKLVISLNTLFFEIFETVDFNIENNDPYYGLLIRLFLPK